MAKDLLLLTEADSDDALLEKKTGMEGREGVERFGGRGGFGVWCGG